MSKTVLVSLSLSMSILTSMQASANNSDLVLNHKPNNDKPSNVLLIMVDDLNDYQGVFGGHPQVKTPNIDKLASQSVRFINAQTNIPVCQPSRNSLFTGVYPHDSKDYGWTKQHQQPVLKHNKTIIELFNENGYFTLGTGKLMHGNKTSQWQEWGNNVKHNYSYRTKQWRYIHYANGEPGQDHEISFSGKM